MASNTAALLVAVTLLCSAVFTTGARVGLQRRLSETATASAFSSGGSAFAGVSSDSNGFSVATAATDDEEVYVASGSDGSENLGPEEGECTGDMRKCCSLLYDGEEYCKCGGSPSIDTIISKCDAKRGSDGKWYDIHSDFSCHCA